MGAVWAPALHGAKTPLWCRFGQTHYLVLVVRRPHMGESQSGFLNLKVIRSDSPIASYFAWSKFGSAGCPAGALRRVGGNVQTPKGWSLVSFGLALISDFASRTNPALRASSMT